MEAPSMYAPKVLTIGSRSVCITRCAATEAIDLELSLARAIGGGVGIVMESIGTISTDSIVAALGGIAQKLTHTELLRLMNLVFKYTMIDGQPVVDINLAFANRPRDVWETFYACVEYNLGPLGDWLREKFQKSSQTQGSQVSIP